MTGNSFGKLFKITTCGESHGGAVGVIIDGCPSGLEISEQDIQVELDRRKPGQSSITTPRKEEDLIHILSGVFEGKTTGTPILLLTYNKDMMLGTIYRAPKYDDLISFAGGFDISHFNAWHRNPNFNVIENQLKSLSPDGH